MNRFGFKRYTKLFHVYKALTEILSNVRTGVTIQKQSQVGL